MASFSLRYLWTLPCIPSLLVLPLSLYIYIYILQRFLLNRRMYIKLGLSSLEITSRFFHGQCQCVRVCVSAVVARAEFAVGSNPRNPIAQPSNFMPNQCA